MLGKRTDPSQQAFADLLRGLFHWKLDTSDNRAYSLDPKDYPRLPLFSLHKEQTCYLNQVFWLVYNDATTSWRSLSFLHRSRVEDIEALADAEYDAIPESASGDAQPSCPKISKTFVAYLEGLVVVAPYHRGTADPRASGYAEEVAADAFEKLDAIKRAPFKNYLKRKLGEWYRAAPKRPATARRAPDDDDDEPPAQSAGAAVEAEDGAGTSAIAYGMD